MRAVRARRARRPAIRRSCPPAIDPLVAEEHGALARGRRLRLRAVRHRRRPAADAARSRASTPGRTRSGVIDAYRDGEASEIPDVQLALVGSMATDDPEGWEFFHAHLRATPTATPTSRSSTTSTTSARSRSTPSSRRPTSCIQKSIREGFGLTVTEALWKGRPTIGGDVGGIPLQIEDGETGYPGRLRRGVPPQRMHRDPRATPSSASASAARGKEHARDALPHAAPAARLAADLHRARAEAVRRSDGTAARAPLDHRLQPRARSVRARRTGELRRKRGGGGLVTALTGLVAHRDALWIASAMTEEDVARRREARRAARSSARLDGVDYRVLPGRERPRGLRPLLQRDRQPDAVVHPALPLGPLQRAGHPPRGGRRLGVRLQGRQRATSPRRSLEEIDGRRRAGGDAPRLPPLHAARARSASARPDAFLHHFVHIPWTPAGLLAGAARRASARRSSAGCSPTTSSASTPRAYCRNFLQCCRELMELEVDYERGAVRPRRAARSGSAPTRSRSTPRDARARSPQLRARSPSTSASCCAAAAST